MFIRIVAFLPFRYTSIERILVKGFLCSVYKGSARRNTLHKIYIKQKYRVVPVCFSHRTIISIFTYPSLEHFTGVKLKVCFTAWAYNCTWWLVISYHSLPGHNFLRSILHGIFSAFVFPEIDIVYVITLP